MPGVSVEKHFHGRSAELQIPPLRSPGFPVELDGVDATHAPFFYGKAHTWTCPVQRGRKSGYATVGMTKGRVALPFRFDDADDEQQVPPLRYPGFPVELDGVDATHAPFSYGKGTRGPVQCSVAGNPGTLRSG
jgi:hypothetical protein